MVSIVNLRKVCFREVKRTFETPERIFLILGIIFGLLSLFFMPKYSVPDEGNHFSSAFGLTSLDVVLNKPGHWFSATGIAIGKLLSGNKNIVLYTGSDTVPYFLGRLCNLSFYITVIYQVIKRVNFGKWTFMIIALFPTSIMLGASLSYDAILYPIYFVVISSTINIFSNQLVSKKQIVILCVCAYVLAVVKFVYLAIFIPLLFVSPNKFYGTYSKINHKVGKWFSGGVIALFGFLGIFTIFLPNPTMFTGLIASSENPSNSHVSILHFLRVLFNTFFVDFNSKVHGGFGGDYFAGQIYQMVGSVGWYAFSLPSIIIFICMITLAISFLDFEKVYVSKVFAIVSLIAFFIEIALICYSMYTQWSIPVNGNYRVASGLQGRYIAPILPLLLPISNRLSKYFSLKVRNRAVFGFIISLILFFTLCFYIIMVVWYYHHMHMPPA